jgi:hypothetical protein
LRSLGVNGQREQLDVCDVGCNQSKPDEFDNEKEDDVLPG